MTEILLSANLWIKAFHIISVIAWMAGIFYLPRLFVYHVESVSAGSETDHLFQQMERRLLKVIMTPAMIASWAFGLLLVATPGTIDWSNLWPWTKAASVVAMTWFHIWLALQRKSFLMGQNKISGRRYRLMNEVPTILLLIIVISVVVRPV